MADRIQVDGARQLRSSLKRAGVGLDDLKAAHAEAGQIVNAEAKIEAPKRSGRLAASVRSSGTKTAAVVRAGYASVPYAGPIHFGWPRHHIKAQPFITNSARKTEPRWVLVYKRAVDRLLSQIRGA